MTDRAVLPPAQAADGHPARDDPDDLTSLRAILLGPAEAEIQRLQARLDDRYSQARDVSAVLPQALRPLFVRSRAGPRAGAAGRESHHGVRPPRSEAARRRDLPDHRPGHPQGRRGQPRRDGRVDEPHARAQRVVARASAGASRRAAPAGPLARSCCCTRCSIAIEQVFLIHRKTGLLLQHVRASPRAEWPTRRWSRRC